MISLRSKLPVTVPVLCSLLFSATAAASTDTTSPVVDPLSAASLLRVFGSLGIILATVFALAWLLKRSGSLSHGRGGKLRVVDVLSLGQRERVVVVAVGDQQLVLGVAPGRVQTLHTIDEPFVEDETHTGPRFADLLQKATRASNGASGGNSHD